MIKYDNFWVTMKKRGISQYVLIKDYNISNSLLHRLRMNEVINTNTLDTLCNILDCDVEDILTHYNDEVPKIF